MRVKCLAQEHNTMSAARARTRTIRSVDERTNHEATAPLTPLAYDLLEDRRTIDVITTKFFPLCFKMAEKFEHLDNILRDWAKDKVQKSLVEVLNRYEKQEKER